MVSYRSPARPAPAGSRTHWPPRSRCGGRARRSAPRSAPPAPARPPTSPPPSRPRRRPPGAARRSRGTRSSPVRARARGARARRFSRWSRNAPVFCPRPWRRQVRDVAFPDLQLLRHLPCSSSTPPAAAPAGAPARRCAPGCPPGAQTPPAPPRSAAELLQPCRQQLHHQVFAVPVHHQRRQAVRFAVHEPVRRGVRRQPCRYATAAAIRSRQNAASGTTAAGPASAARSATRRSTAPSHPAARFVHHLHRARACPAARTTSLR
jgi:hypothetical protein